MLAILGAVVLGGILLACWVAERPHLGSGPREDDPRSIS
jgi:hypothetical protein